MWNLMATLGISNRLGRHFKENGWNYLLIRLLKLTAQVMEKL
jgi:hypothetical protein